MAIDVWVDVNVRMSGRLDDNVLACPCCGITLKSNALSDHLYDDHSANELVGSLWQYAYYHSKKSKFRLD